MDSSSNEPSVSKEPKSNERRHYANKKEKIITEQKESLKPNASNVNVPIKAAINEGRRESASKVISGQSNLNHSKSASVETEVPKPKTRRRRYNRGKKEKVNIESKISTNAEKQGEKVASTSTAVNSKTITKNTNETEARPKTMPVTNKSERSQTKKYNGQNGMTDQVPSTSQSVKQKNISNTKPKRQHQYNVKKGLTPYQGNRQVFGTFKCNECSTKWTSDCSYADKFQFCKKCDAKVYPFRQVNYSVKIVYYLIETVTIFVTFISGL